MRGSKLFFRLFVFALLWCSSVQAQTFSVLHAFVSSPDGAYPYGGVVPDATGNLYGVTYGGGRYHNGLVYKIDPSGKETVLHALIFHDGCLSFANPILDSFGNLYGTTSKCGSRNNGTLFELKPSGKLIVLHTFGSASPDVSVPLAGLLLDSAGNLYGTGSSGGNCCQGGVFQVDRSTGAETILYEFGQPPDGAWPESAVIRDASGHLYGTNTMGGQYGYGTVFKVDPTGMETLLWAFTGGADGAIPIGGLVRDQEGNLYGTTYQGGFGGGAIFKLDPTGVETILHNFGSSWPDGSLPHSGLTTDAAGNLYGTTQGGGTFLAGTVYMLARSGAFKILHSFTGGKDGAEPAAGLIRDAGGNLYGTTTIGGSYL